MVSLSLLVSDPAALSTADLWLMSALPVSSHFARCRRHHARHPTGHSSVGSQQDLKRKELITDASFIAIFNYENKCFPILRFGRPLNRDSSLSAAG